MPTPARIRFIDNTLDALGVVELGQLVILGAGFDAGPYRQARLDGVPIFEVDHPDTQLAKRRALTSILPTLPPNVTFVPSDFNLTRLSTHIADAGYRPDTPRVILWEGVSNYLNRSYGAHNDRNPC
jgi:methyltransferase (TIGR00027 family)